MNQRGYYSRKVRAGKRTYFFDVRATRNGDFFMTITESKKKHDDSGFENHKVFIYKEDFHKFIHALKEGLEHIHTDLNELDIQDINEPKHTIEEEVKEDEANPVELSDDLNHAIEAKKRRQSTVMVSHSLARLVAWYAPPLENHVRLWTYIASRPLKDGEVNQANMILSAFVSDWTSHGDTIHGTFGWIGNHAVVIASPISQSLSGCGIDQNISAIRAIEEAIGIKLLDRSLVLTLLTNGEYSTRSITTIDTITDEQLVFMWNTTKADIESTPIFVPLRESGFKQLPKNTGLFSSL